MLFRSLETIEAEVNAMARANGERVTRLMSPDAAVMQGAMALFGEKYGEEVRVVAMGEAGERAYSVELCGGTHVRRTGDIGLFKIVTEGAVASGVRRIEAMTGDAARRYLNEREAVLLDVAEVVKAPPHSNVPSGTGSSPLPWRVVMEKPSPKSLGPG